VSLEAIRGPSVAALAADMGRSPRTLQRRIRASTGLPPKQWIALLRFREALQKLALARESLAQIAAEAGYSDQAHLTTELSRHAGMPPGRLRAAAQRQIRSDVVRFFKDDDIQARVQLLIAPDAVHDEESDEPIQTEGSPV
jgi:AraC-like DNA-binding protein